MSSERVEFHVLRRVPVGTQTKPRTSPSKELPDTGVQVPLAVRTAQHGNKTQNPTKWHDDDVAVDDVKK